jgi:DNA-binding NtrC family response regulator
METVTFQAAVSEFKRQLIASTLARVNGNRTHAARALGLQRTYFLRLLHDLEVNAPPSPYHPELRGRKLSATN